MARIHRQILSATPSHLPAQSLSNHLQPGPDAIDRPPAARLAEDIIRSLPARPRLVATIQYAAAARASEVLALTDRDIDRTGLVFIRARKGSASRTVHCPEILTLVPRQRPATAVRIFGSLSYYQYRRHLLGAACGRLPRSGARQVVSNLFRRAAAQISAQLSGGDLSIAQHRLGHRSPGSTKVYTALGGGTHG